MFENQTYEVILNQMLDRVSKKFDKREGSVIWDTHSPTAIEFQILYIELDNLLQEVFGDTASREFLIMRCRERGIDPYPATNAILKGIFTPANVDVIGKRFNIGALNYIVLDRISDGEYRVQCETPGTIGNQYMGQMIPIEYVEGLETAELTEVIIPGEDEEDTEALRERYFNSFGEFAFGGNRADYYQRTKAIDGVGDLKIERVWNAGIRPADMIPSATVERWYNSTMFSIEEVQVWLDTVFKAAREKLLTVGGTVLIVIVDSDDFGEASPELIDSVQTALDPEQNAGEGYGIAPIGHVVNVKSATPVPINVTAKIAFNNGSDWANTKNQIEAAVEEYLLSLRKDWSKNEYLTVRIAQIESKILSIPGVVDILGTKINGSDTNIALSKYQIPVFGSVTNA